MKSADLDVYPLEPRLHFSATAIVTKRGHLEIRADDFSDAIVVGYASPRAKTIVVTVNGVLLPETFRKISCILIVGGAGNDDLSTDESRHAMNLPVEMDANGGDDRLIGGSENDVLLGGTGNDTLAGGNGANLMIGGAGGTAQMTGGDTYDTYFGGGSTEASVVGGTGRSVCFCGSGIITAMFTANKNLIVTGSGSSNVLCDGGHNVVYAMRSLASVYCGPGSVQIDIFSGVYTDVQSHFGTGRIILSYQQGGEYSHRIHGPDLTLRETTKVHAFYRDMANDMAPLHLPPALLALI